MKNYKWLVVFLIFIFIAVAYWLNISNVSLIKNYQEGKSFIQKEQKNELAIVNAPQLEIDGHKFFVELAQEPAVQRQGLSGRASLASDTGMLFIYPEKQNLVFWMKDMNFSLDLLWIDGDTDTVVALEKNMLAPAPGTTDQDLLTYAAPKAVDKVFEINAGLIDQYGIKVGDKITYYNIQ